MKKNQCGAPRSRLLESKIAALAAIGLMSVLVPGFATSLGQNANNARSSGGWTVSASTATTTCGAGSSPEDGIQGEVPLIDRQDGRNLLGYRCNLQLVGQYQGQGASWVDPSYGTCAYLATSRLGREQNTSPGVQVIDAGNPSAPILSTTLTSPAMLAGTWESLKINQARKLLGGAAGGYFAGVGFFDVYDISNDCAHPVHLNVNPNTGFEAPDNFLGHEGDWSPDGMTYWSTGVIDGSITAIDVSNTRAPRILYTGRLAGPYNHGLAVSADGTRLYLASLVPAAVDIYDVSDIQNRVPNPAITLISQAVLADQGGTQHVIPVTYAGKPYLIVPSELRSQGVFFIDISDETQPKVVNELQLAIQAPANAALYATDVPGDGFFGYEAHYCSVDQATNPTALACGMMQSGVRVFNIVSPTAPHEIAYFNPPAQMGKAAQLPGSEHGAGWYKLPAASQTIALPDTLSAGAEPANVVANSKPDAANHKVRPDLYTDWCSSPPRFVGTQLWVTCQDNGFMVLQFTNGVYPIQ